MNSLRKLTVAALLSMSLIGCSTLNVGTNALTFISEASTVKYYYDNGQVVNHLDAIELKDDEIQVVIAAMDTIDKNRVRLQEILSSPQSLIENLNEVSIRYTELKRAYIEVRVVVQKHWGEFTPLQQVQLLDFDTAVLKLDREFTELVVNVNNNQALNSIITLTDTTLRIAAML